MPRMQIQNAALTAKRNHIDAKMYPIDTLKKVYRVLLFIMRKIIGAVRYDKEISYKNEQDLNVCSLLNMRKESHQELSLKKVVWT